MARRRRSFSTGVRRATFWSRSADISAPTVLALGAAVLDQSISAASPATIIRTRGTIWCRSDQAGAAEHQMGAVGFAVVSDQALAVGVTAVPTPITDKDSDLFFVHQYFASQFVFVTGVGLGDSQWQGYDFDSKAMRKINEEQALVAVVENASASFGLEYILQFATLFKLGAGS